MPDELPPDPDAIEKWRNLPQDQPSKQSLPPLTGGRRWLWGMLVLFGVQIFGVSTEILKILAFGAGVEAQKLLGFSAWGYEFLALAYQLGFLVLPPVVPVMLWFGQFQDALEAIIGRASPSP